MVRRLTVLGLMAGTLLAMLPLPASGAEVSKLQKELDAVAAEYGRLETALARTDAKRRKLEADLRVADKTITEKAKLMQVRAGAIYKKGGMSSYISDLILAPSPNAFFRRLHYMEVLGRGDTELIDGLRITQARADEMRAALDETRAMQASLVERQGDKKVELEAKLRGARSAAKVSKIRSFPAFTLPVGAAQAFANTWGAPRSGGRRHKGTDVMAACGAPVVAVTDGVIGNLHNRGNAGIMAYLTAPNGDVFFYAHLKGYAPGISNGSRVTVGQKIGYNGNTGNARGGPCHVHFEWHKGGGGPVNPYPLLNAAR
ncbi:MAG TPA: peptidoglycan DD-metalloendopeptidase family protein [Actinomycetota bacterium]|nr:peptidoglycan DD-metalloendopeptidase family protein [Actinomycetota bacterium]